LNELKYLSAEACDTLECRIEAVLEKMASVELCVLPADEPLTVDEFLAATEERCAEAAETLTKSVLLTAFYIHSHANSLSFTCFFRIFDAVGCGGGATWPIKVPRYFKGSNLKDSAWSGITEMDS